MSGMTTAVARLRAVGDGASRWVVLLVLCVSLLLVAVDATVLHVAVPAVSEDLRPSGVELLWIVDAYPLVCAALLILFGTLGDRVGRRLVLLLGYGVFGLASALAAFADTPGILIGPVGWSAPIDRANAPGAGPPGGQRRVDPTRRPAVRPRRTRRSPAASGAIAPRQVRDERAAVAFVTHRPTEAKARPGADRIPQRRSPVLPLTLRLMAISLIHEVESKWVGSFVDLSLLRIDLIR